MTVRVPSNSATRDQIVALQTLYSQWANHNIPGGDPRSARLRWASEIIGRQIGSFSDLTREEGRVLIDTLKGLNGQPFSERPHPWRRVRSRERAHAAGTAGRRGEHSDLIQMAGPDDFARIDQALARLGWTNDRYEAWLRSGSSPLTEATAGNVRTVAQANKVWWALKAILRRSGQWHSEGRGKTAHM